MRSVQKIALSLLISVVAFSLFALLAFSGLFRYVESNFYDARVRQSIDAQLSRVRSAAGDYVKGYFNSFRALLSDDSIKRIFSPNQSSQDIFTQKNLFQKLLSDYPGILYVRFVDERGNIHFSTLATDVLRSDQYSVSYKTLANADPGLPVDAQILSSPTAAPVVVDAPEKRLLFRLPAVDTLGETKGTAIFYVSAADFSGYLLKRNLVDAGKSFAALGSSGFVLGIDPSAQPDLAKQVLAAWSSGKASPGGEPIAVDAKGSQLYLFTVSTPDLGKIGEIVPQKEFALDPALRTLLSVAIFLTAFLLTFLLLSLKQDKLLVLADRVKRFQINFLREYLESKSSLDWGRWYSELELRRNEVRREIKRGIGAMGKERAAVVDGLIDKSWDEILSVVGKRAEEEPASLREVRGLEDAIRKLLASGEISGGARGIAAPAGGPAGAPPAARRTAPPPQAAQTPAPASGAEALATTEKSAADLNGEAGELEEVEPLEEVEEAETVEELDAEEAAEEVEELEALEEVELDEAPEEAAPSDAPEEQSIASRAPVQSAALRAETSEALDEPEELEVLEEVEELEESEPAEAPPEIEPSDAAVESSAGLTVPAAADEEVEEVEELEEVSAPAGFNAAAGEAGSSDGADRGAFSFDALEEVDALDLEAIFHGEELLADIDIFEEPQEPAELVTAEEGETGLEEIEEAEAGGAEELQLLGELPAEEVHDAAGAAAEEEEEFVEFDDFEEEPREVEPLEVTHPQVAAREDVEELEELQSDAQLHFEEHETGSRESVEELATIEIAAVGEAALQHVAQGFSFFRSFQARTLPPTYEEPDGFGDLEELTSTGGIQNGGGTKVSENGTTGGNAERADRERPSGFDDVVELEPLEELEELPDLQELAESEQAGATAQRDETGGAAPTASDRPDHADGRTPAERQFERRISNLIRYKRIEVYSLADVRSMELGAEPPIEMADGVYRIRESVYSAQPAADNPELKELIDSVAAGPVIAEHSETAGSPLAAPDETGAEGAEREGLHIPTVELPLSGFSSAPEDSAVRGRQGTFGGRRDGGQGLGILTPDGFDYDSYGKSFKTGTLGVMKSLMRISQSVDAIYAAILTPHEKGFASQFVLGLDEASQHQLRFPPDDIAFRSLLSQKKLLYIRIGRTGIPELDTKLAPRDLKFIQGSIYLPITFSGSPAYLFFGLKGSGPDIQDQMLRLLRAVR